jgi:hypothetical protein
MQVEIQNISMARETLKDGRIVPIHFEEGLNYIELIMPPGKMTKSSK